MALIRDESITVHDAMPFSREFRVENASALKVNTKAMLMFRRPGHERRSSQRWHYLEIPLQQDHLRGGRIPRPQGHHHRARPTALLRPRDSHCRQPDLNFVLEDHGLVVQYGSRNGGVKSQAKTHHLSSGLDHFLIAHPDGTDFTYNPKSLPQTFNGRICASGPPENPNVSYESVMTDVPRLVSTRAFHNNVALWGIHRFTKSGGHCRDAQR